MSRLFFNWMTLFVREWDSDNNNMNDQLDQVCFSFIHPSLSLFSFFIHWTLQFVLHFIQLFKVNIYIYVLTNDALTQKVIVLLCSIHLTFDTYAWFELSHEWMVPAWIHMRIIINETKREEIFANRKNNYHSISRSPSLSFYHIIDNTLKWNVGDNSMSY
jgi:hypothetical protein